MQIKDLTTDEFKALIRETVTETFQELLDDSDLGKKLKAEVEQRLTQSLKQTNAGEQGVAPEEVAKQMGLTW